MKIFKFFGYLAFGSVLGKVAFAGYSLLPGNYVDLDALSREFDRKGQWLSPDTLEKFSSAAEVHNKALEADDPQLWFDALELYGELEFGRMGNGRSINLTMESYTVAQGVAQAFEELSRFYPKDESYRERAALFAQRSEELYEKAQEEAYRL